jgi:hypothetical protein
LAYKHVKGGNFLSCLIDSKWSHSDY